MMEEDYEDEDDEDEKEVNGKTLIISSINSKLYNNYINTEILKNKKRVNLNSNALLVSCSIIAHQW